VANTLEILLRAAGRNLADHQIAYLFKVPEDMNQTPCDFFGYTAEGRAIMLEAKQVKRLSLPIGQSPGLAPHQWAALDDANRAGVIALIAWQNGKQIAVLSMDQAKLLSRGRKSIAWREINDRYIYPQPKPSDSHSLLMHWLCRAQ